MNKNSLTPIKPPISKTKIKRWTGYSKKKKTLLIAGIMWLVLVGLSALGVQSNDVDVKEQHVSSPSVAHDQSSTDQLSDSQQDYVNTSDKSALDGPTLTSGDLYKVVSVVDGDTIKVNISGRTETIRFVGMDTPEVKDPRKPVQCFGKEASGRMQHYARSKYVRLEADDSQGDRDKYNRLLRYVYTESGENIAYVMIKEGYAHEYTYSKPYKYQAEFKAAYAHARDNQLGLWSPSTCSGNTTQPVKSSAVSPKSTPAPKPAIEAKAAPVASSEVYYKNCTQARAAGVTPIYRGQPGYAKHLDRDNDGIACEYKQKQ